MLRKIDIPCQCSKSISFRLNPTIPIKRNFISEVYYNPKLEELIEAIKPKSDVDLSYWNLVDQDMSMIFKRIIIDKQVTQLCLCGNKLTSQGASILAFRLPKNSTLRSLDLSHNHIDDAGIYSLSEVLLPNHCVSLEKLLLNKNGISNDGMRYLGKMLKKNQTLTELSLSNNEIGNEGIKHLATILINYNRTLKVLVLSFNIFITDSSLGYLLEILEHNQTLTNFSINDCNLSETGKLTLRERAARKKKFHMEL